MNTSRDSFIFYRSFFESLSDLDECQRGKIFTAICEYALNGNLSQISGVEKAIFTLIKPQLDANTKKYLNGNKGGRPPSKTKPKPNNNLNETKPKANENDNLNHNVNYNHNGNGRFDVLNFLDGDDLIDARIYAPGWDIQNLVGVYNEWVNRDSFKRRPASPKKAFHGWLPKYTKGKIPN